MAKPKKKRDLRARLGRTITPKTQGAGSPVAPPGGAVPPPALGGAPAPAAKKTPSITPPPAGVTPPPSGVAAPPAGIGGAPPGGIVAPPFAQAAAAADAPAAPSDPFTASAPAPAQQQVVRLEFDDALVKDAEVGKAKRFTLVIVSAVVLAVGLAVGFLGGSTHGERKIFDATVRDAQGLHASIDTSAETMSQVQRQLTAIVDSMRPSEASGEDPAVNYEAIEALRGFDKPFEASAFTGKNYNALPATTVHDIFAYLMNIDRLWREFASLAAMALPPTAREQLDSTVGGQQTAFGAVLSRGEEGGRIQASLLFLSLEPPAEEGGPPVIHGRATRNGRPVDLTYYSGAGGEDEAIGTGTQYVVELNMAHSRGVPLDPTGLFGQFVVKVAQIRQLLNQTIEIQGRLLQAISQALTEAGASTSAPAEGE